MNNNAESSAVRDYRAYLSRRQELQDSIQEARYQLERAKEAYERNSKAISKAADAVLREAAGSFLKNDQDPFYPEGF